MKSFTSHIDYLIQKHDCVIIPDFGGFILSKESAFIIPNGAIRPPRVSVGFNPDLKYNDGLLAESYMNVYSVSYDAAIKRVKENSEKLTTALSSGQSVQIGNLGRLRLDANKQLIFTPNNYLSLYYPDTYGLSLARVQKLSELMPVEELPVTSKSKRISFRNILTGTAAAAAAVLVFFVTSTPILKPEGNVQQSGFIFNSSFTSKTESRAITLSNIKHSFNTQAVGDEVASVTEDNLAEGKHFIVVGSAKSENEASNIFSKLEDEGLDVKQLQWGKNGYRLYITSFQDLKEAESYLINFRKENPKHKDAWIYSVKG